MIVNEIEEAPRKEYGHKLQIVSEVLIASILAAPLFYNVYFYLHVLV